MAEALDALAAAQGLGPGPAPTACPRLRWSVMRVDVRSPLAVDLPDRAAHDWPAGAHVIGGTARLWLTWQRAGSIEAQAHAHVVFHRFDAPMLPLRPTGLP